MGTRVVTNLKSSMSVFRLLTPTCVFHKRNPKDFYFEILTVVLLVDAQNLSRRPPGGLIRNGVNTFSPERCQKWIMDDYSVYEVFMGDILTTRVQKHTLDPFGVV